MALIPVPLPTASDPGRFTADGPNRLFNVRLEKTTFGGKVALALYPRSGFVDFATLTGASGGVRALFVVDNTLYAVAGRMLYRIDTGGTVTQISGGIPADGPVYVARNMATIPQVSLVAGSSVYILQGNVLSALNDPDLSPPADVAFLDGRLLYFGTDGKFTWSAINDTGVDGLDFAEAESHPDGGKRIVIVRREVWLIGDETIEVWSPTGDADLPFQRLAGGVLKDGCRAAGSVATIRDAVLWVARDGTVRIAAGGYSSQRISTHAVERSIAGDSASAITSTTYDERGHSYYVLSGTDWTWTYDLTYGVWVEDRSYGYDRLQISAVVQFGETLIAGDALTGQLYTIDADADDDAGTDLVVSIRAMLPNSYPKRQRVDALFVEHVPGRGLLSSTVGDDDPQIVLRTSADGGMTWSSADSVSMGLIGEYDNEVVFRRLGLSGQRGMTLELSCSAKVRRGIVGMAASIGLAKP